VQKTNWNDRDAQGNYYFNLTEVRLFADTAVLRPLALSELTAKRIYVGQTLNFALKTTDEQNRAVNLTATGLPENATFTASTGRFRFAPHSGQAGKVFTITFGATGGQTRTAKQEVVVLFDGAPNVVLTAPTVTTPLVAGQSVTITWATDPSARVSRFQVKLSTGGGVNYNLQLTEVPGNVGQYRWVIPANFPTTLPVRFMVTALDATNRAGLDYSKQNLRVSQPAAQSATR